ncbi:MAG: putative hydrolase [Gammaproteobacteria bacterium]|jgi:predicted alpha/beta-fold hydrolase|nr:putative hydrolase [Gammaproteobacteria bacterium]
MSFKPFWGLHHPMLQTILGAKIPSRYNYPETYQQITLPDGDILVLAVTTPPDWIETMPSVVALHGLGGSHQAGYISRLRAKIVALGYRFIALNFRGCGAGAGLAKGLYNAGCSADVLQVVQYLKSNTPNSPLVLIGYSLGGNVALKLAGELKEQANHYFSGVIAITPPVDLANCADLMRKRSNAIFRRYYIRRLWQTVKERHASFPELGPTPKFDMSYGFWEFDEVYTGPQSGYLNAKDYYRHASALSMLTHISLPCKILFAADDPFIDCSVIKPINLAPPVEVLITSHGGHMGFLAAPMGSVPLRWMDHKIRDWVKELV